MDQHLPLIFFLLVRYVLCTNMQNLNTKKFPKNFLFGTATSAYQIEGAWNESGKGENIWDRYTHDNPNRIKDGSNGDISCDAYHKYKEDVALIKNLGLDFYRFSVSWSRILPGGFAFKVNPDGIRFYNDLIDTLLDNSITPMITIFHWDTPQPIEELGGFTNVLFIDWFEEFARILFENFGNKVKLWLTFNEPDNICSLGYGLGILAPGYNYSGIADYMCAHNLLKAHARVYHLYDTVYRPRQKGRISIALNSAWFEPASNLIADIKAAERSLEFMFAWIADPVFGATGDYPQSMKELISIHSTAEGLSRSRLPEFTPDEINFVKGSFDYFALNHYSTLLAAAKKADPPIEELSPVKDLQVEFLTDPSWKSFESGTKKVVPWGFRKLLNWIKNRYRSPEIMVTESGFSDYEKIDDLGRIDYYKVYLSALLDAIHEDKVNVTAYTAWSLMDNFEWIYGYDTRFGLYHVNFSDPKRTRTPKASANYYKQVVKNRRITTDGNIAANAYSNCWLFIIILIFGLYNCY